MTAYDDVPQVSMLYAESEMVNSAIAMIDAGATLTNFTIGPPRAPGSTTLTSAPGGWPTATAFSADTPPTIPVIPVSINVPGPVQDQLMLDLRAWLVQRETDIQAELTALGVTAPPPVGRARQAYGPMGKE